MSIKKAYRVNCGASDFERIHKYKGTYYLKFLTEHSYVQFLYGSYSTSKPLPLHFHEEIEFLYVRQDRGAYYLAGKIYPFQKRLLLIAKPNEIHALASVPLEKKNEWVCLVFPLGWLGMELDVKSWPREVLLSEDEAARFDMVCGQVSEEVKNEESGYEDMIRVKFQEICCLVRRIVSQPKKERVHPLVDQLREYINQHFNEKINILALTKNFGYTKQYIARVFKKTMRLSLKRYILQRRVIEARVLLETNPELKMAAIAEQVGFEDYRLFHRIFKILTGVKPESYRHVIQKAVAKKGDAD